jgi:hypothetical protein
MSTAVSLPDCLTVDAFLAWDAPMGFQWQLVDGMRKPWRHSVRSVRLD